MADDKTPHMMAMQQLRGSSRPRTGAGQVTEEQIDKLREWIVAIIDDKLSGDTSDGGLAERIRLMNVEKEVRAIFAPEQDNAE